MIRKQDLNIGTVLIFKLDKDVVFEVIDNNCCEYDEVLIKNISGPRMGIRVWRYFFESMIDIMEMSLEEINEKFDVYFENPIDKLSWSLRHEI